MDENGDGKVTKDEFVTHYQKAFAELVPINQMMTQMSKGTV